MCEENEIFTITNLREEMCNGILVQKKATFTNSRRSFDAILSRSSNGTVIAYTEKEQTILPLYSIETGDWLLEEPSENEKVRIKEAIPQK